MFGRSKTFLTAKCDGSPFIIVDVRPINLCCTRDKRSHARRSRVIISFSNQYRRKVMLHGHYYCPLDFPRELYFFLVYFYSRLKKNSTRSRRRTSFFVSVISRVRSRGMFFQRPQEKKIQTILMNFYHRRLKNSVRCHQSSQT